MNKNDIKKYENAIKKLIALEYKIRKNELGLEAGKKNKNAYTSFVNDVKKEIINCGYGKKSIKPSEKLIEYLKLSKEFVQKQKKIYIEGTWNYIYLEWQEICEDFGINYVKADNWLKNAGIIIKLRNENDREE